MSRLLLLAAAVLVTAVSCVRRREADVEEDTRAFLPPKEGGLGLVAGRPDALQQATADCAEANLTKGPAGLDSAEINAAVDDLKQSTQKQKDLAAKAAEQEVHFELKDADAAQEHFNSFSTAFQEHFNSSEKGVTGPFSLAAPAFQDAMKAGFEAAAAVEAQARHDAIAAADGAMISAFFPVPMGGPQGNGVKEWAQKQVEKYGADHLGVNWDPLTVWKQEQAQEQEVWAKPAAAVNYPSGPLLLPEELERLTRAAFVAPGAGPGQGASTNPQGLEAADVLRALQQLASALPADAAQNVAPATMPTAVLPNYPK